MTSMQRETLRGLIICGVVLSIAFFQVRRWLAHDFAARKACAALCLPHIVYEYSQRCVCDMTRKDVGGVE